MKLLPLVLRNALRNKRRTILTIGSLMAALAIFMILRTILTIWADSADIPEGSLRVIVRNKVSLANVVPEKYAQIIKERIPGVAITHPYHWVGGHIKDHERDFFQQFACEDETFFDMWSELRVPPEVKDAWKKDRTACLAGKKTMEKYGWKTGSRFTLLGTIYPTDLELTVVGTYDGFSDDDTLFLHRSYLMESLGRPGIAGTIYVRVKDSSLIPQVIQAIDAEFESSDTPTRTETEKDFLQSFVNMLGNVKGFFSYLTAAVLGAMLLVIVNTMAMAVRERTREIAVMKAIGFTPGSIVWLVVSESVLTCLVGGVVTCVGARLLLDNVLHRPALGDMFPNFYPSWETVGIGVGIAFGMGLISGIMPAVRAARLGVVAGLRRVG